MKVLSFNEWRNIMVKDLAPDKKIDCPDCYGTGEAECEECGAYSECEDCEGKGKVLVGDVSEKQIRESLTRNQYADALQSDLSDLAEYTGANKYAVLADHGFQCSSHIDSKRESICLPYASH